MSVDREALEHSLVRRLLDHIEHQTTDMADDVLEVPIETYTSREHFEKELQALFLDHPLVLALSGSLPKPGSYLTVDMCGTPILLTRDQEGRVHALANVCRHRGVRVVDGGGEARRFTCPFHAWVYDLEGNLVGVPVASGFEGMCREQKGLIELPVAEGYGLIVGRLRPGKSVDIDALLGPELTDELATLDFVNWEPYTERHTHRVSSNWKATLDTYRENYHFNYLHRTTLAGYAYGGVLTFDAFGRHLRNSTAIKSIDSLREVPEEQWGDVFSHFSYQYNFFPNTCLSFDARHVELWQIVPVDEHSCEVLHSALLRPGLPEEERAKAAEMLPWICENVVDAEDFWVANRTEPGIRTGLTGTVVFGRNEVALQHLHRGFWDALDEAAKDQQSHT
ncbi:MAG: Rieske 2Fe-2S domain-containing protein [Acidimicrobiaceae bacterium]|nr:Rieske 2Fe-2S domain-containing protein [Acidimicrobiaceae bacterium]